MKALIIALVILIPVIAIAIFGFHYWQQNYQATNKPVSIEQTLTGVLQPIPSTGEYSDVIVDESGKTTGVTSNTVNVKVYENKRVQVMGQYSGSTMYADSITIVQ